MKKCEDTCLLSGFLSDMGMYPLAFAVQSPSVLCVNKNKLILTLLLLLCGDILPNPGPTNIRFPSTVCCKSVSYSQKGIECSRCERWTHASCANVSNKEYAALSADETIVWYCPECVAITSDLSHANCSLSTSVSDCSVNDCDLHTNSSTLLHRPLLCTCFNARSVMNKQLDLYAMINTTSPDVIVITETFLDCSILDGEVIPQGYLVFRCDRNRHGRGVLIVVSLKFPVGRLQQFEPINAELLWVRILIGSTSVILGGFYRPPESTESYLLELESSLHCLPPNSMFFSMWRL